MKKILLSLAIFAVISGCSKNNDSQACQNVLPITEEPQIISFCNTHSISYSKDTSGIFYQIIDIGSGMTPDLNAKISVTYKATYLNDITLDEQTTPVVDFLRNFIEGWRIAIPLIRKGGHIKMVIPSSLCYGCLGYSNVVPPNAILFFELTLVDVQ